MDLYIGLLVHGFSLVDKHSQTHRALHVAINPLTAPACKISGLKDAQTRLQIVYFPVL